MSEISNQIDNINNSIAWINKYKPAEYNMKFLMLVEERRKLRKLEKASKEKPAIAAFGESQKGKSYLMGNLLQNNGSPFMVKVNSRGDEINFVQSINPIGDKKEATGVVTRFTTFTVGDARFNPDLPVIVKLLSPASIATILCDSYHKDIMDYETYSDAEIEEFSTQIYDNYKDCPDTGNTALVEDDILEIKDYLSNFLTETQALRRSRYFENLALVIRKVPVAEWASVLQYLWHGNKIVTEMFARMVRVLQRLDFAKEVYTDIETVRHHGDNTNTIMSVDCLNGLDNNAWNKVATVCAKGEDGRLVRLEGIPKCELAAVCAETVYKVEPEYVNDEMHYSFDAACLPGDLPAESRTAIGHDSVRKELLNSSDLLDFPGARNRLRVKEIFLDKKDEEDGTSNAVQMLLRGKVAYLFNSYSESRMVNILLFCHDAEAIVVNDMYIMLNDWVERYVGKTADDRRRMIEKCGGISPLFNVCTKFNIDMVENENDEKNNEAALNQRWSGRFMKVLYTQAFKANDVDWFRNWDGAGRTFSNSYLLRDFKYSGCTGSGNNLYDGYKETDEHPCETEMKLTAEFYDKMRRTFIGNADVRMFFDNPSLAWDVAATRNNDGSLFIIDKLCTVASNAAKARESLFGRMMMKVRQAMLALMGEYFISTDVDEILENNIRKAKAISREMDFTCNSDNYFFGHLLQALQMSESTSYQVVHSVMNDPEVMGKIHDFKNYEIIRNSCKSAGYPLEEAGTDEAKWQCIMSTYGFGSKDEAEEYLNRRGIDVAELFKIENARKKNSCIIGDSVYDKWGSMIKSVDFLNKISGFDNFDSSVMSSLADDMLASADALNLRDRMAESIATYVDVVAIHTANEDLIADTLSSMINEFVLDFGFKYLSADDVAKARSLCEKRNLRAFNYIEKILPATLDEKRLTEMFNEMSERPQSLVPSFEDNYNRWIEFMFISFVAHLGHHDFDPDANKALAMILESIKAA